MCCAHSRYSSMSAVFKRFSGFSFMAAYRAKSSMSSESLRKFKKPIALKGLDSDDALDPKRNALEVIKFCDLEVQAAAYRPSKTLTHNGERIPPGPRVCTL